MKPLLRQFEAWGIALQRNWSGDVTRATFRLTTFFAIVIALTMILVDWIVNTVRTNVMYRNLLNSTIPPDKFDEIMGLISQTVEDARQINYPLYISISLLLIYISYRIAVYALRPVEESLAMQRRFIVNAAHELRTPLSIARSEIDVHNKRSTQMTPEGTAETLGSIGEEVDRMKDILRNLSLISHIYTGQRPSFEVVDLASVLLNLLPQAQRQAESGNIRLTGLITETALPIEGNTTTLTQIFTNIIGNAIKYTRPGGAVRIFAFPEGRFVTCIISDTGIGMTPGEMGRMFEPFFRGERVQHLTGSGLGLALVKELVTVHGGKILCTSTPDVGTTMTIKLPRVFLAE